MKLQEILHGLDYHILNLWSSLGQKDRFHIAQNEAQGGKVNAMHSFANSEIADIRCDSRLVKPGDLYIAIKGYATDGHKFIKDAINRGAKAVIVENGEFAGEYLRCAFIKVKDSRKALAVISRNFFKNPDKDLTLIGITGTSGKTTSSYMLYNILSRAGINAGIIGSIGIEYNEVFLKTNNTTPGAYEIYKTLSDMKRAGISTVIIEVSSQAFKLDRLYGITFDIGCLTNISYDHIGKNEHKNMEEYISCKNALLRASKKILINNDSNYLEEVLEGVLDIKKGHILTYGIKKKSDIYAYGLKACEKNGKFGISFFVKGLVDCRIFVPLPGECNVLNALLALGAGYILGVDAEYAKDALAGFAVKGRFQIALNSNKGFKAIIDYAHTKDAAYRLFEAFGQYKHRRIISVFGAGGGRSFARRKDMAFIIGGNSDICIITQDNPRNDNLAEINKSIKEGLRDAGFCRALDVYAVEGGKLLNKSDIDLNISGYSKSQKVFYEIASRKEAIFKACSLAEKGDIVLLIGKGHETYQEICGIKHYFSEEDILQEFENCVLH